MGLEVVMLNFLILTTAHSLMSHLTLHLVFLSFWLDIKVKVSNEVTFIFILIYPLFCLFSVRAGVDHFKHGRHVEAMNEYNKALEIDTNNVEALVARGAL